MKIFGPIREKLSSSLARRLIIAIIVVSSTITLCLTTLQLYGEYRSELGGIQAVFRQIEEVHLRSLSQSLWATNEPEFKLQIEGIRRVPYLEYIVVREGDTIWAQAGHRTSRRIIERQYPMTYVHRGQTLEIGTLTVVAGLDAVYRGLINKAFVILASNAIKTFLVAGFAFAFFHWLVNRHLLSIAKHLRGLDLRGRASPLILARATRRRPDELDEVAAAINLMHEDTRSLLTELRHKTELAQLLEQLARAANEAVTPEAAMETCLRRICEDGKWALGRAATFPPGLSPRKPDHSQWYCAEPARFDAFMRYSDGYEFMGGSSVFINLVLRDQYPVWLPDLTALDMAKLVRLAMAAEAGLKAAFAFPVVVRGEVAAFLEFFATETRPPDVPLIDGTSSLASQFARMIERSKADETRARLAAIVENSSDAVIGRALNGTVTSWNAAAERILGYTAAEVIGRDPIEIVPPERWQEIIERRSRMKAGQVLRNIETVRIAKDGRHIDAAISFAATRDTSGRIIGTSAILRDITERKQVEKALRKNYELLDRIFATTHFCLVYLDRDLNFVRVNKAYADACGHPPEFFPGKNHFALYPGEKVEAIFRRTVATGEPFTIYGNPFEFPDHPEWGVTYWDWTLHPLRRENGYVEGLLFVLLDVTERKRAEQELERKAALAQLLESLARTANEAVTPEEAMRVCLTRLCGFGNWMIGRVAMTHELGGDFERSGSSIWHAADLARHKEFIRISQDVGQFPATGQFAGVAVREKRPVWISDVSEAHGFRRKAAMLADGLRAAFAFPVVVQGEVTAFLEFFADTPRPVEPSLIAASETIAAQLASLIERSRAEKLNAQLAAIVESSNDAIVSRGLDRAILTWNAAAERLFGYTAAEVIGRNISLIIPADQEARGAQLQALLKDGRSVPTYDAVRLGKGGRRLDVSIAASPIKDSSGKMIGVSIVFRDISERKRNEETLRSYATRLRELSRRLREVEESERRAISRELHDRIGQGLTTLGLMVGVLDARLSRESRSAVQTLLKDMQALVQYAVAHVRDIMAELRPPVLDDYGLLAALRHLVTELANRTGIAVNLGGVDPYPRLPLIVETAMFRISQEALNNIAKHAHAKKVEISLDPASERVVLDIADDGVGFDTSNRLHGGEHWGMITMRERAEAAGIMFRLESAPGTGTRIVLEVEHAAT